MTWPASLKWRCRQKKFFTEPNNTGNSWKHQERKSKAKKHQLKLQLIVSQSKQLKKGKRLRPRWCKQNTELTHLLLRQPQKQIKKRKTPITRRRAQTAVRTHNSATQTTQESSETKNQTETENHSVPDQAARDAQEWTTKTKSRKTKKAQDNQDKPSPEVITEGDLPGERTAEECYEYVKNINREMYDLMHRETQALFRSSRKDITCLSLKYRMPGRQEDQKKF